MSIDASPPQTPPMLSPDGKWFWDGRQWQPIATSSEAVHRGVFPSWNGIAVESVPTAPEIPQPAPAGAVAPAPAPGVQYETPMIANPLDYTAGGITPLWRQERKSKISYPMYVGGGLLFVLIGLVLLNAMMPFIDWPWAQPAPASTATSSPAPLLTTRSDYARADQIVTAELTPAMALLAPDLKTQKETCNGTLTLSCQNALIATDKQLKSVLALISNATIPACISAPMTKLNTDLTGMDKGIQTALKGYADNNRNELKQGLAAYTKASAPITTDQHSLDGARKACDTQLVGP